MPDQHGFGDNRTGFTRPCQSGQGDDQMNEYDSEVAHSGNGINTSKTTALRPNLAIRHRQVDRGHLTVQSPTKDWNQNAPRPIITPGECPPVGVTLPSTRTPAARRDW